MERIRRKTYRTRDEARLDVFDYIEMFYNPKRKHANNGMLSPIKLENSSFKWSSVREAGHHQSLVRNSPKMPFKEKAFKHMPHFIKL